MLDRVLRAEATRLGIGVPEEAVRAYVFGIPSFQGGRPLLPAVLNFLRRTS